MAQTSFQVQMTSSSSSVDLMGGAYNLVKVSVRVWLCCEQLLLPFDISSMVKYVDCVKKPAHFLIKMNEGL